MTALPTAATTPPANEPALDAQQLYEQLREHLEAWRHPNTQWVGIASGGAWIVKRLQHDWGLDAVGVISSAMHRDDYRKRATKLNHAALNTDLPFDVTGANVVLLDDVLFTGRTIRAVLNELFDYGRPASVRLAVLVDRGARELPIAADYAAIRTAMAQEEKLALRQTSDGKFAFTTETMHSK